MCDCAVGGEAVDGTSNEAGVAGCCAFLEFCWFNKDIGV